MYVSVLLNLSAGPSRLEPYLDKSAGLWYCGKRPATHKCCRNSSCWKTCGLLYLTQPFSFPDFNDCLLNVTNNCSGSGQICVNTEGSFSCACTLGYRRSQSGYVLYWNRSVATSCWWRSWQHAANFSKHHIRSDILTKTKMSMLHVIANYVFDLFVSRVHSCRAISLQPVPTVNKEPRCRC